MRSEAFRGAEAKLTSVVVPTFHVGEAMYFDLEDKHLILKHMFRHVKIKHANGTMMLANEQTGQMCERGLGAMIHAEVTVMGDGRVDSYGLEITSPSSVSSWARGASGGSIHSVLKG